MPLTLQFGPWAPDLADVPIQVPDNQGPMVVPCADCLNVYYANGAYRSIPSPTPTLIDGNTVSVLASQALNAFPYYDNVEQQQTVFVGTMAGVQQLISDGTWTTVNFLTQTAVALTGLSMSITTGSFQNATALRGLKMSISLASLPTQVGGAAIVAGNYARFIGKGGSLNYIGYNSLSSLGDEFGSVIRQTFLFGKVVQLFDSPLRIAGAIFSVSNAINPGQNIFTSLSCNGKTYTSASANYSYANGVATWQFPNPFGFATGSTYTVETA